MKEKGKNKEAALQHNGITVREVRKLFSCE